MGGGCLLNEDRIFNSLWYAAYKCFSAVNACQNIHTVVFFALCAIACKYNHYSKRLMEYIVIHYIIFWHADLLHQCI